MLAHNQSASAKATNARSDINGYVFEVDKNNLENTQLTPLIYTSALLKNEVVLSVDKFALTANNISYGITGDSLGYWRFFPKTTIVAEQVNTETDWGRLPVMGFADVVTSNNPEIKIGDRVFGFMPMATHIKILTGRINDHGFSDISPHRQGLSPLYSAFEYVEGNPFYQPKNENFEILVRGLFLTSWLVDDFMHDNHYFGASQYLITSASSKTSIALAFAIKQRGKLTTTGITSASNQAFVKSLACYDHVITYDAITDLDPRVNSILVDMAGSTKILKAIHYHFTDKLHYSCRIGATHHGDMLSADLALTLNLPGAIPRFFFAPTQLKKRTNDWGANKTMHKIGISLLSYINFCRLTMTVQHTTDRAKIVDIYQEVLSGQTDASIGQIISL